MHYKTVLSDTALDFLRTLTTKDKNICKKNLQKLYSPYPGRGDKEKLVVAGEEVYRLYIGRSYTVFYIICEKEKLVKVLEVLTIEAAHKKYGFK